jgi:hypothetical protein
VFTARYELSPYTKQTRFVFKGLNNETAKSPREVGSETRKVKKDNNLYSSLPHPAVIILKISHVRGN